MTFIHLQKIDNLGLGFQQKFSSSKSSYLKLINLLSHAPRKLYLRCLMIWAGNVFNQCQPQYKMLPTRHYYFNPSIFGFTPKLSDLIYTRYASHNFISSFLQLCSRGVSVYLTKNRVIGQSTFPVQNTHKWTCHKSHAVDLRRKDVPSKIMVWTWSEKNGRIFQFLPQSFIYIF